MSKPERLITWTHTWHVINKSTFTSIIKSVHRHKPFKPNCIKQSNWYENTCIYLLSHVTMLIKAPTAHMPTFATMRFTLNALARLAWSWARARVPWQTWEHTSQPTSTQVIREPARVAPAVQHMSINLELFVISVTATPTTTTIAGASAADINAIPAQLAAAWDCHGA